MTPSFTSEGVTYSHLSDRGRQVWHAIQLERISSIRPWSAILAVGALSFIIHTHFYV